MSVQIGRPPGGASRAEQKWQESIASAKYVTPEGWSKAAGRWSYSTATRINVPSESIANYTYGTKVKLKQGGDFKYFNVVGKSTSGYLDILGDKDSALTNATITDAYFSNMATPESFPMWFNYEPAWEIPSGPTLTDLDMTVAKFRVIAMDIQLNIALTFDAEGAGDYSAIRGALPKTAGVSNYVIALADAYIDGATDIVSVQVLEGASQVLVVKRAGGTWNGASTGNSVWVDITYAYV
jgi:hypothetical protein